MMITYKILLMFITLGLSSSSICSISTPFIGVWIQAGLADIITINNTWSSLKGTCINEQQDVKNKYIFYNEQTRCKRCILFISRHLNVLQYRESECFDSDDDNGRICGSITPDTVLYTLFRDNAESIPCLFDQSWYFKKDRHICQPKAFHNCLSTGTFQLTYNNKCLTNQNVIATCFAQFSDGNINYIISRSVNQQRFICFSYTKTKDSLPNEIYLSKDNTCRDLFTRESAILLTILPRKSLKHYELNIQLPKWTQGTWLSIATNGMNTNTFYINKTQLIMKMNGKGIIKHDLEFIRVMQNKQQEHDVSVHLRAKCLEQCSSIFYCVKLIYRSSFVIDLSIGYDEHGCNGSHIHYTLYRPTTKSDILCPQIGMYKSSNTYQPPLSVTTCSTGLWTLSVGCEIMNKSELTFSSTCRHDIVPDVQVITSIKGICLASWRVDYRFQRTLILYEKTKAFCLIQPLKSMTASWILSESSCTNIGLSSINIENSLRYSDHCEENTRLSNICSLPRISYLLFYLTMQVLIYIFI